MIFLSSFSLLLRPTCVKRREQSGLFRALLRFRREKGKACPFLEKKGEGEKNHFRLLLTEGGGEKKKRLPSILHLSPERKGGKSSRLFLSYHSRIRKETITLYLSEEGGEHIIFISSYLIISDKRKKEEKSSSW